MRRTRWLVSGLLLVAVAVGCGDGEEARSGPGPTPAPNEWSPPDRPADIRGPVAELKPDSGEGRTCPPADASDPEDAVSSGRPCTQEIPGGAGGALIVDGTGRYPAASFSIDDGTAIRRRSASGYAQADLSALTAGASLEVWFVGPVAESDPVQAKAGTIVIDG